ncbi:MAG TPA: hypothetical protein VGF24_37355 [Vicinamibacterales bacterium]|jgi:hypothetical protein
MALKVRVFHAEIARLAEGHGTTLPLIMEHLADQIAEAALEAARKIIPQLPPDFLTVEHGEDTRGLFFRVFPDATGADTKWADYLSAKEQREHAWFEPAVASVVGPEHMRISFF